VIIADQFPVDAVVALANKLVAAVADNCTFAFLTGSVRMQVDIPEFKRHEFPTSLGSADTMVQ
jgi:hypothetical protein